MPSEHYCLKWNNFQNNIVAALGNLKLDEDFVDVTLSCEGKSIKAHKVILSACSEYFRDVFRENPCTHPVVILRDASFVDVEGLVRYVYRGEVDVHQERLPGFLKTAELLKIKGLGDQSLYKNNEQEEDNNGERDSPVPAPQSHVPCPVSPLNVPHLGFRPNHLLQHSSNNNNNNNINNHVHQDNPLQNMTSLKPTPPHFTPPSPQTPLPTKIISSPIRVPIPPSSAIHLGLKRSHFSNLAQYLSGSTSPPRVSGDLSPSAVAEPIPIPTASNQTTSSISKRRKTTPKKKSENHVSNNNNNNNNNGSFYAGQPVPTPPHYSGSTSSLTASPASPPHSTEGEGPLEICEESDRESARSSESNECPLKSLSFGLLEKSTSSLENRGHSSLNPYHRDTDEPPLVIEDQKSEPDDLSYGETLDLSRGNLRGSFDNKSSGESTSSEEPNNIFNVTNPLPVLPLHINAKGENRKGSLSLSDSLTSRGSVSSMSPTTSVTSSSLTGVSLHVKVDSEDRHTESQNRALAVDCSLPRADPVIRRPKAIKASIKKSSSKYQRQHEEDLLSETQGLPLANAHQQQQQQQLLQQQHPHQGGGDDDDDQQSQHPRNRWRCMQPRLCNYCWKTFSNSFNLKQHIVNVHIQSQGVTCTLCAKVVKNKWYLRKHLVTAHGAPLKRVKPEATSTPGKKSSVTSSKKPLDMTLATAMALTTAATAATRNNNNRNSNNGDFVGHKHRVMTSEEEEDDAN